MRILGIDPGLTRCGICVLDAAGARRISLVSVGVARTDPQMAPHQRLLMISQELEETIHAHRPDVVAVERVFAQDNVRSVMSTAQVVGIVLLAAAKASLPVGMHSPSEVKAAVTGNGRAQKIQVQTMVQRILGLDKLPRPKDAADAIAVAICHAWRGEHRTSWNWIAPSTVAQVCCLVPKAPILLLLRKRGQRLSVCHVGTEQSSLHDTLIQTGVRKVKDCDRKSAWNS